MRPYRDQNQGGAILGFQHGPRHITVAFANGDSYRYTHGSAGMEHVELMKRLANQGSGLTGYIQANQPQHEELS